MFLVEISRGRRIVKKDEYRILRISANTNTEYRIPNRRIANTEYQILPLLWFTFKIIFNRFSHLSSFSLHFLWIKLKILSLKQNIGFFHQNLKSFIIKIKDFSSWIQWTHLEVCTNYSVFGIRYSCIHE